MRGPAPATRETDLCRPGTLVERANAIFLTGGSAFGLDATAGVMRYLRERSSGFATPAGPVPIVPAAAIFDLVVGEPVWPDPAMAYTACESAMTARVANGSIGAGAGATVGKLHGPQNAAKSGQGTASTSATEYRVGALMVVNAVGNIVSPDDGRFLAGAPPGDPTQPTDRSSRTNTTIGVVATDAPLASADVSRLASVAQDALVRVIRPAHTLFDGDAIFALSTAPPGSERIDPLRTLSLLEVAVTDAVIRAVLRAIPGGV